MKKIPTTSLFSVAAIVAASASVAFVSGGPTLSVAASQSIPWVPGRMNCAKPGETVIRWGTRLPESHIPTKFPSFVAVSRPAASLGVPAGGYTMVALWQITSMGHHAAALCKRVANVAGTVGANQTATAVNHTSIACEFPQGMQMQARWLDTSFHAAQVEMASGTSRAAAVVATMSVAGTKLTYNPRVCRKVAFGYVPPAASGAGTTTTTDTTTTP